MTRFKNEIALTNHYDVRRAFMRALLVLFGMLVLLIAFVLTSADVLGQDKWMVTPSRGGAEGARAQAQLTTIQNESMRMNACTVIGRIYAPTHPNRDANDCIPHLTLNPTTGAATFANGVTVNGGGATVTGNSTFNNNLTVSGATAVNNTLNVTGTSTFGNNMTVNGRVTANQLFVGSGNVGSIPTCTSAQQLHWTGVAWSCTSITTALPSGMVVAFSLATCPAGWSPLELARGRFIVGAGSLGADNYVLGGTGGSARHTLSIAEMPHHSHGVQLGNNTASGPDDWGVQHSDPHGGNWGVYQTHGAGGNQPHENRPPYLALLYCVKN